MLTPCEERPDCSGQPQRESRPNDRVAHGCEAGVGEKALAQQARDRGGPQADGFEPWRSEAPGGSDQTKARDGVAFGGELCG